MKQLFKDIAVFLLYIIILIGAYCLLPLIVFLFGGEFNTISHNPLYAAFFISTIPFCIGVWMYETLAGKNK